MSKKDSLSERDSEIKRGRGAARGGEMARGGMAKAREGVMARARVQGVERACCVPGQGDDDDITFPNKV